jgi:Domain of unknown function (DUF4402)
MKTIKSDMKSLVNNSKSIAIILTIMVFAFTQLSFSQNGKASATIVPPLQLIKTSDLSFGEIVASSQNGQVSVGVNNSRIASGGVQLIATEENLNSAAFDIQGFPNSSFTVSMPSYIFISQGSNDMKVENFVSSLGNTSMLDSRGVAALKVGATLNVNANQPVGMYTGAFDVIVAYN